MTKLRFITASVLEAEPTPGRQSTRQGWERGHLLIGESGTIYAVVSPIVSVVQNPPKQPSFIAQRILDTLDAREQVS